VVRTRPKLEARTHEPDTRFRNPNPRNQAAAELDLRPQGHQGSAEYTIYKYGMYEVAAVYLLIPPSRVLLEKLTGL
jgi:hypothetical protein